MKSNNVKEVIKKESLKMIISVIIFSLLSVIMIAIYSYLMFRFGVAEECYIDAMAISAALFILLPDIAFIIIFYDMIKSFVNKKMKHLRLLSKMYRSAKIKEREKK